MKLGTLIAATVLLALAGNVLADQAPAPTTPQAPQTASVGGGVKNPWRPPYRTAMVEPAMVRPE